MIKNKLLILGMSPGNGYFKQEVIDKLLVYCLEKYEKIGVFIPDVPAISTYVALGYQEKKSYSKAILQGNNFRNRLEKSIVDQNLKKDNIRIFNWTKEDIENNFDYKQSFSLIKNLYENNLDFQKDINLETEKVLINNKFAKKEITKDDIRLGSHYILSEFAFLLFILDYLPDSKGYTYGYHKSWPVWERFISGVYDGKEKDIQFLLLPDFSI